MLSSAEITSMTSVVVSSLDITVTIQRKTTAPDGYGHTTETWVTQSTPKVNIMKPSATQLQAFAGIIGSQWAALIRFALTTDIREGDHILYQGQTWLVQHILNAESYTFVLDALMTVVV